MTLICPVCHSRNSVEAAIMTEAGQAYTRLLLRQPDWLRYALARYIFLFAPAKSEMAYDRRLRLAEETLALAADHRRLAVALAETVEAIMAKRQGGDVRPLTKHNYLLRVLEGLPVGEASLTPTVLGSPVPGRPRRPTRIEQAEQLLAEWAMADPLRRVIGYGLAALLALPLAKSPEPGAIDRTAALWERDLRKHGLGAEDWQRVETAFGVLLGKVKDWFPTADALFEHLPAREKVEALPEPPASPEERARAKQFFAELAAGKALPLPAVQDEEQRRRLLGEQARLLREGGTA